MDYKKIVAKLSLAAFKWQSEEQKHLYEILAQYQEVTSVKTCSLLCANENNRITANSWIYQSKNRDCSCTNIARQLCANEVGNKVDIQTLLDPDRGTDQNPSWLFIHQTRVDYVDICVENILAITGHPFQQSDETESETVTFDAKHGDWSCERYPPLPVNLGGATGGTFNDGTVIVCGGYQGYLTWFENKCYILSHCGDTPVKEQSMISDRYLASSVVDDRDRLFVMGGFQRFGYKEKILDSVEIISPKSFAQLGTSLPFGLAAHCSVKVNDTLAFAIGGRLGFSSQDVYFVNDEEFTFGNITSSTFFFDFTSNVWTIGPSLTIAREGHSCGKIVSPGTGKVFVIVAGGLDSADEQLGSTEIWMLADRDLTLGQDWSNGPNLAMPISYAAFASIHSGSRLALMGGIGPPGYLDKIWIWTCSESHGCWQELSAQSLPRPRAGFLATLAKVACLRSSWPDNKVKPVMPMRNGTHCQDRSWDSYNLTSPSVAITRRLCCHGGNLCQLDEGDCKRDSDCHGALVCGCSNCPNSHSYTGMSSFGVSDNCCAHSKDSCFTLTENTERPFDGHICQTDDECLDDQRCLGSCKPRPDKPETCCANVSVPANCSNDKPLLLVKGLNCFNESIDGIFVRYSPSTSGSWSYIQLGNYDTNLAWETKRPFERLWLTTNEFIPSIDFYPPVYYVGQFRPPGWVLMRSRNLKRSQGAALHLAYTNNIPSSCLEANHTAMWSCYEHNAQIAQQFGVHFNTPPKAVMVAIQVIQP